MQIIIQIHQSPQSLYALKLENAFWPLPPYSKFMRCMVHAAMGIYMWSTKPPGLASASDAVAWAYPCWMGFTYQTHYWMGDIIAKTWYETFSESTTFKTAGIVYLWK